MTEERSRGSYLNWLDPDDPDDNIPRQTKRSRLKRKVSDSPHDRSVCL